VHFRFRHGRFYTWCTKKSLLFLYSGTTLSIISIAVLWYIFIALPLNSLQNYYIVQYKNKLENQKACLLCFQKKIRLQNEVNAIEQKLNSFQVSSNALHTNKNEHRLFSFVDSLAKHTMHFNAYIPQEEKNKAWYKKYQAQLSFEGSFESLMNWFNLMKSYPYIQIKEIDIRKKKDDLLQCICAVESIHIIKQKELGKA